MCDLVNKDLHTSDNVSKCLTILGFVQVLCQDRPRTVISSSACMCTSVNCYFRAYMHMYMKASYQPLVYSLLSMFTWFFMVEFRLIICHTHISYNCVISCLVSKIMALMVISFKAKILDAIGFNQINMALWNLQYLNASVSSE